MFQVPIQEISQPFTSTSDSLTLVVAWVLDHKNGDGIHHVASTSHLLNAPEGISQTLGMCKCEFYCRFTRIDGIDDVVFVVNGLGKRARFMATHKSATDAATPKPHWKRYDAIITTDTNLYVHLFGKLNCSNNSI